VKFAFSRPTGGPEQQRLLFAACRAAGYDGLQLKAGQYRPYLDDPEGFLADWGDWPPLAAGLIMGGRRGGGAGLYADLREDGRVL